MPAPSFQFGSSAAADVLSRGADRESAEALAREAAIQQMISQGVNTGVDMYNRNRQLSYQQQKDLEDSRQAELERQAQVELERTRQTGETDRLNSSIKSNELTAAELRKLQNTISQRDTGLGYAGLDVTRTGNQQDYDLGKYSIDTNAGITREGYQTQRDLAGDRNALEESLTTADRLSRESMQEKDIKSRENIEALSNINDLTIAAMGNETTRRGQDASVSIAQMGDATERRAQDLNKEVADVNQNLQRLGLDQEMKRAIMTNDTELYRTQLNAAVQLKIMSQESADRMYAAGTERMKAIAGIKLGRDQLNLQKFSVGTDAALKFGQLGLQKYDTDTRATVEREGYGVKKSLAEAEASAARAPDIQDTVTSGKFDKIYPSSDPAGKKQMLDTQLMDNVSKARSSLDKAFSNNTLSANEITTGLRTAVNKLDVAVKDMTPTQFAAYQELKSMADLAEERSGMFGGSKISGDQAVMVKQQIGQLMQVLESGNGQVPQGVDTGLEKPGMMRNLFDPFTPSKDEGVLMNVLRNATGPMGNAKNLSRILEMVG